MRTPKLVVSTAKQPMVRLRRLPTDLKGRLKRNRDRSSLKGKSHKSKSRDRLRTIQKRAQKKEKGAKAEFRGRQVILSEDEGEDTSQNKTIITTGADSIKEQAPPSENADIIVVTPGLSSDEEAVEPPEQQSSRAEAELNELVGESAGETHLGWPVSKTDMVDQQAMESEATGQIQTTSQGVDNKKGVDPPLGSILTKCQKSQKSSPLRSSLRVMKITAGKSAKKSKRLRLVLGNAEGSITFSAIFMKMILCSHRMCEPCKRKSAN